MSDAEEPTATDERVAMNEHGVPIVPVMRDGDDSSLDPRTGLPVGFGEGDPVPKDDQATAKT